jgi:hypothetical protein
MASGVPQSNQPIVEGAREHAQMMSFKHEHHKTYLVLVNSAPDRDRVRVTSPAAGMCSSSAIILHRIRHCQLLPCAVAQVALLERADLRLRGQAHGRASMLDARRSTSTSCRA